MTSLTRARGAPFSVSQVRGAYSGLDRSVVYVPGPTRHRARGVSTRSRALIAEPDGRYCGTMPAPSTPQRPSSPRREHRCERLTPVLLRARRTPAPGGADRRRTGRRGRRLRPGPARGRAGRGHGAGRPGAPGLAQRPRRPRRATGRTSATDKPLADRRARAGHARLRARLLASCSWSRSRSRAASRPGLSTCSPCVVGVLGNRLLRDGSLSWLRGRSRSRCYPAYLSYGGWGGGADGDPPDDRDDARSPPLLGVGVHVLTSLRGLVDDNRGRPAAPAAAPRAAHRRAPAAGAHRSSYCVARGRGDPGGRQHGRAVPVAPDRSAECVPIGCRP